MDTFSRNVATAVRVAADGRGWSQSELARQSGVPRPTIHRYFYKGDRDITLEVLGKVSTALGISVSEILRRAEGADEPKPVKRPVARRVTPRSVSPQRRAE